MRSKPLYRHTPLATVIGGEYETAVGEFADLNQCNLCQGLPEVRYDPGCIYSVCKISHALCPCVNAAPDYNPKELILRINEKNRLTI